jgi:hypothetical protein
MDADLAALPDDIDALKAALLIARAKMQEVTAERDVRAAELAVARAKASEDLVSNGTQTGPPIGVQKGPLD